ncbi:MAG: zinc ribbon domain-containing protein [Thermodesulfobacteriota bacterium]|nr:zinc ribbon domain-containing protein [Thermodesulfobacteriota bacterium]
MKCPNCDKEIPGSTCPQCTAITPAGAKYCMDCGFSLGEKEEAFTEDDNGFDLENRVLCPDGACTGIIIDGRCTECGKASENRKTKAGPRS